GRTGARRGVLYPTPVVVALVDLRSGRGRYGRRVRRLDEFQSAVADPGVHAADPGRGGTCPPTSVDRTARARRGRAGQWMVRSTRTVGVGVRDMTEKVAESSVELHELIARRWSPRAFDPDEKISDKQLRTLVEAARLAPSYGNPLAERFLDGPRGLQTFVRIVGVLTEANQAWAHRVSVLFLGLAVTHNEKCELPYASYGVALAAQ